MSQQESSPECPSPKLPRALAAQLASQLTDQVSNTAIEDFAEADEDLVKEQRQVTQSRLDKHYSAERLLHKVIPFHWAPMLTPLNESDIQACLILDTDAFPNVSHRVGRDKIEYRIRKCDGLCAGLFNSYRPNDAKNFWINTMANCREVETGRQDGAKHVLFAHVIATLGEHPTVTDSDMNYPKDWQDTAAAGHSTLGRRSHGRTLCLHSVAVCPEVLGVGVGSTVMRSYIELVKDSGLADRVALICRSPTMGFFEHFGFKHIGPSQTTAAGPGWQDMVFDFTVSKLPKKPR